MAWVPVQQQQLLSSPQQQYSQQHAQQHQPTMSSQFHLFPLIETIGDALERGVRDHHVEELVNDLLSRFEACQQILNSPSNVSNLKTLLSAHSIPSIAIDISAVAPFTSPNFEVRHSTKWYIGKRAICGNPSCNHLSRGINCRDTFPKTTFGNSWLSEVRKL